MIIVISVFGDVDSLVRCVFLVWLVVFGFFFVFLLFVLYYLFVGILKIFVIFVVVIVGLYGIGDCIFIGLFSINMNESFWNLLIWIYNIGFGLGYVGFLFFLLLFVLFYC